MARNGTLRLNCKKVFFTYSQCNLDLDIIYRHWNAFGPIAYAVISTELHEDGNEHKHGYIEYVTKIDIQNAIRIQIQTFKPNAQCAKEPNAVITYVKKDGNYREWGTHNSKEHTKVYELAKISLDRDLFFQTCMEAKISFQYAHDAWEQSRLIDAFTITEETLSAYAGVIGCETLLNLLSPPVDHAFWIKGPSGIGKTTWALKNALKPCLFVKHQDTLRKLTAVHRSIVFDDMMFAHLPRETQIQMVDSDHPAQIHCRYGVASIPARIQKIFTSNVDIFDLKDLAIERRIRHRIDLFPK